VSNRLLIFWEWEVVALSTRLKRVLVVDDYEGWHVFVATALREQSELKIIARIFDGLEAIQQAKELQPDLILLDIGLPNLNGIEAARRIHKVCLTAKILFVSENRSPEIAEEALNAGGSGYIIKSDAAKELLPAIRTVLQGRRFVSARFAGHFLVSASLSIGPTLS
jgi:DNA-binding NarL/FixJ family response regulator